MKDTTFEMLEVCGRWRGAFSEYMLSVAHNCENYDSSYTQIASHLTSMKSNWSELKKSAEEQNLQKKEHYSQLRQKNQEQLAILNNHRAACPKVVLSAEGRAKYRNGVSEKMLKQTSGDDKKS